MRVQRFGEHRAMPWANGRGTSYEIASDRDDTDRWSWRVAIAPVVVDGQFSSLPGVNRELVVIEGNGMVLKVGGESVECWPGRVVRFSGDSTTFARLVDGPVVDLGLMTVRDSVIGSMVVIADAGDVIETDVLVAVGEAAFEDENGQHYVLEANDALLDARGHRLMLQSGAAISIKLESW
jgi:environmental stress-induced protein Ves